MKKIFMLIMIIIVSITLVSCIDIPIENNNNNNNNNNNGENNNNNNNNNENDNNNNNEEEVDEIAPIIMISSGSQSITVPLGDVDLLQELLLEGVTAIDDRDGDITHKIIVDSLDVLINELGTYTAYLYVADKAGNVSQVLTKEVKVVMPEIILQKYEIFLDQIPNEKPKPGPQSVFKGAWYYKVVSSVDNWLGIEGTIILPEYKINRYNGDYNNNLAADPDVVNLDNPSIYLGGNASNESDVGLSLSRVLLNVGTNEYISTGSYVFRPFWRYITSTDKDVGGYDLASGRRYAVSATGSSGNNMIANWYYADTEYYYLPGDKVRMLIHSPKPNYLQMQIEVIEKSTLPSSVEIRRNNNWKDPENFFSPIFRSPGHGATTAEYKRVNAIDQSGNEAKPVIPTTTEVFEAIWESVYLYRKIDGVMYRVPFNENRASVLGAPESKYFTASKIDELTGGMSVSIHPGRESN